MSNMTLCNPLSCVCGRFKLPQRYLLAAFCFLSIICCYNMRVSFNILIQEMVAKPNKTKNISSACPRDPVKKKKVQGAKLTWSPTEVSTAKAMFFPGYIIAHIPGGLLSDAYGGRWAITASLLISVAFTIIIPPLCTVGGPWAVAACRFLVGVGQGLLFPAISTLLARWVPKHERGFLGAFAMSGTHIGTITGFAVSGWLVEMFSWKFVYYFWTLSSLAFTALQLLYLYSYPDTHPFITDEEKEMLETAIAPRKKKKYPWAGIFSDPVVWGIAIGQFGHGWIFFTYNTDIAKYMDEVLGFAIANNGFLSALPSACMWVASMFCGLLADWLYKKRGVKIVTLRRWFTVFANIVPCIFGILATYSGCNRTMSVSMLVLSLTTKSPYYSSLRVNHLDISTNYAGMVNAIVNAVGAIAGYLTPYVDEFITKNHTAKEWQTVFWIASVISVGTTIFYFFFVCGERRQWDKSPEELENEAKTS